MTALGTPAETSPGLDADYHRAQQRIVRAAVERAQTAWRQPDPRAPSASWVEQVRPQVVTAVEQAQQESAALAPLYLAGTLLAAGAVSAPLALLAASAFAKLAADGLVLGALMDFASATTVAPALPNLTDDELELSRPARGVLDPDPSTSGRSPLVAASRISFGGSWAARRAAVCDPDLVLSVVSPWRAATPGDHEMGTWTRRCDSTAQSIRAV